MVLSSEPFRLLNPEEIDNEINAGYNQIVQKVDEFQENGSGWVVDHLIAVDLSKSLK